MAAVVGVAALTRPAVADVGDPCDVQASGSGAGLYLRTQLFVTETMTRLSALPAFGCATRSPAAPSAGNWNELVVGVVWTKAVNGTPITFYKTTLPVLVGGVDTGEDYWVASTEVTLDEP